MTRPLKFCFFSTFYPPYSFGGDAIFVHNLAQALARRGHEVDVIHCLDSHGALKTSTPTQPLTEDVGITVHALKSRWGVMSPLLSQQTGYTWLKTARIQQVLDAKKFDVIHYHNISLFGPRVLRIEPAYSGFVKLYTTHEHWLICPMHILWKNNERLCDKPDCLRCTLSFRRPPQWWRYTGLLESSLDSVDAFLCPSRFTRDMHYQRGFRRTFRHLPSFAPDRPEAAAESPHHRPYFLFVGRLEKIKGVQEIIPVFRTYPHADLLVAGAGSYEPELRRLAEGMANVVFLGWLSHDHLAGLYKNATALLLSSVCYEVFSLTVLEAFAQHTPVIAHALGGLEEIVNDSGAGFTYSNHQGLITAMEKLRQDGSLRRHLGEMGYRHYAQHCSEQAYLGGYFKILAETAQHKYGYVPWEGGSARN